MASLPKHILVIRLSAMGDVAMVIPVLRAFCHQYPEVKITVLTRAFFKPFFRDLKQVSVYDADVKGKHKGVYGLYKLSKALKALNIDAVADLHNALRSKILKCFLPKPFIQIDKGRPEKKALVSGDHFKQLKTTHQRYIDVFSQLGFPIELKDPDFPKPVLLDETNNKITGKKTAKWIGIAPFAAYKSKMYPLAQMEKVIEELSKTHQIFLFGGGKEEVSVLKQIEEKFSNTKSLAGQLTLEEELDVISNLDVMISMDSSNGHIAAMLGVKVVTIWGVTHPYAGFIPFNQPEDHQLLADRTQFPKIPTSVYGNKFPEVYEQVAGSISVNTIINKIKEVLNS